MNKKFIFLDTNFFLHFKDFDQIKWQDLLGCDSVQIIIPPITLHELDEKKHDPISKRNRERSKKALKKIYEYSSTKKNLDLIISLKLLLNSPKVTKYKNLIQGNNDDEFIASILDYKNRYPDIGKENLLIISDDIGLLNKALSRNISFIKPSEELMLEDEPTTEEKKLKSLEYELKTLKNKEPELELVLSSNNYDPKTNSITIELIDDLKDEHLQQALFYEMEKIKLDETYQVTKDDENAQITIVDSDNISSLEIIRYENDCNKYLKDFEDFIRKQHAFRQIKHRLIHTPFILKSIGNVPAINTLVFIIFPPEIYILKIIPAEPKKPPLPEKPKKGLFSILSALRSTDKLGSFSYLDIPGINEINRNKEQEIISIQKNFKKQTEVKINCGDLKHKLDHNLPDFFILFPNNPIVKKVIMHYKILADNLSNPIEKDILLFINYQKLYNSEKSS